MRWPILLLISLFAQAADLRLPNIFGNGMVLQRDKPVAIWGWGATGAAVEVRFGEATAMTTVDDTGEWSAKLPPVAASSEAQQLTVKSGDSEHVIDDVLVGDLWLIGGQSNMEWTLRSSRDADLELAAANYPQIRFIRLPKVARFAPQSDFPRHPSREGNWHAAAGPAVENCSGVGYYFARRLHWQLKVPIGLIDNSWGGTMAQHWCSKTSLAKIPEVQPHLEKFATARQAWIDGGGEEGAEKRQAAELAKWEIDRKAAKEAGEREPRRPNSNAYRNPDLGGQPGGMFNGSLMPIARATIRGILFYQGENNSFATAWKPYHRTLPQVIADWRSAFGDPALPFGMIQIAGWSTRRGMSYDMNHHCNVIREIQFDTWQRTPNTGLVVTFDTNSNGSIHPGRKMPVGERAARWALAEVYGSKQANSDRALEWQGPIFADATFTDSKAIVTFRDGTDRGLRLDQDLDVGFVLAGEDQVFHHARARIASDKDKRPQVIVWSEDVPNPVAVRYAQSNLPIGGLMNARELPAFPFRSDDWPLTPHQSTGDYVRSATLAPAE